MLLHILCLLIAGATAQDLIKALQAEDNKKADEKQMCHDIFCNRERVDACVSSHKVKGCFKECNVLWSQYLENSCQFYQLSCGKKEVDAYLQWPAIHNHTDMQIVEMVMDYYHCQLNIAAANVKGVGSRENLRPDLKNIQSLEVTDHRHDRLEEKLQDNPALLTSSSGPLLRLRLRKYENSRYDRNHGNYPSGPGQHIISPDQYNSQHSPDEVKADEGIYQGDLPPPTIRHWANPISGHEISFVSEHEVNHTKDGISDSRNSGNLSEEKERGGEVEEGEKGRDESLKLLNKSEENLKANGTEMNLFSVKNLSLIEREPNHRSLSHVRQPIRSIPVDEAFALSTCSDALCVGMVEACLSFANNPEAPFDLPKYCSSKCMVHMSTYLRHGCFSASLSCPDGTHWPPSANNMDAVRKLSLAYGCPEKELKKAYINSGIGKNLVHVRSTHAAPLVTKKNSKVSKRRNGFKENHLSDEEIFNIFRVKKSSKKNQTLKDKQNKSRSTRNGWKRVPNMESMARDLEAELEHTSTGATPGSIEDGLKAEMSSKHSSSIENELSRELEAQVHATSTIPPTAAPSVPTQPPQESIEHDIEETEEAALHYATTVAPQYDPQLGEDVKDLSHRLNIVEGLVREPCYVAVCSQEGREKVLACSESVRLKETVCRSSCLSLLEEWVDKMCYKLDAFQCLDEPTTDPSSPNTAVFNEGGPQTLEAYILGIETAFHSEGVACNIRPIDQRGAATGLTSISTLVFMLIIPFFV